MMNKVNNFLKATVEQEKLKIKAERAEPTSHLHGS